MARANQQLIVIFSTLWITTTLADYYSPSHYDQYYQVPAYYQYSWEVKDLPSGNDYRQQETRDGHLTTGLYQVLLPGGRHQTVNYRVDKDSGFMADVSYQGENNYFTFKSNYQHQMSSERYNQMPSTTTDSPSSYYNPVRQPESYPSPSYYPQQQQQQPAYQSYNSAVQKQQETVDYYYPATVNERPATSYYNQPTRNKYGFDDEPAFYTERTVPVTTTTTEPSTTTTTTTTTSQPEIEYANKPDYSVPMYPLYRADFYSARAKSVKSTEPQQQQQQQTDESTAAGGGYGVDEEGYTYIKPSAKYSIPDKLGAGYEVNHRKATMRKPTYSDYQAPDALIVQ